MYITETAKKAAGITGRYKLSYIDEISPTVWDYTPETLEYMKTEEYKNKTWKDYSIPDPKIRMGDYPNEDYVPGFEEYRAYFCEVDNMNEVWGDDFNDIPYEHNSGCPYDTSYGPDGKRRDINVMVINFAIPQYMGTSRFDLKFPCTDFLNSPWSTEMINFGAVPWIFFMTTENPKKSVNIMAGITPQEFMEKIRLIWRYYDELLDRGKISVPRKYKDPVTGEFLWMVVFKSSGTSIFRVGSMGYWCPVNLYAESRCYYYDGDVSFMLGDIVEIEKHLPVVSQRNEVPVDEKENEELIDSIVNHWKLIGTYDRKPKKFKE